MSTYQCVMLGIMLFFFGSFIASKSIASILIACAVGFLWGIYGVIFVDGERWRAAAFAVFNAGTFALIHWVMWRLTVASLRLREPQDKPELHSSDAL